MRIVVLYQWAGRAAFATAILAALLLSLVLSGGLTPARAGGTVAGPDLGGTSGLEVASPVASLIEPPAQEPTAGTVAPGDSTPSPEIASDPPTDGAASPPSTPPADGLDPATAVWFEIVQPSIDEVASVLYVGTLDGRALRAWRTPARLYGAGPAPDGRVLVWWHAAGETVVRFVDGRDGSSQDFMRREGDLGLSLDPSGEFVYWIETLRTGQTAGLWRRPTGGGPAERILTGWKSDFGTEMTWSPDGVYLVLWTWRSDGYDYRVLDVATGLVREVLGTTHGSLIGWFGDQLVVYEVKGGERHYPLIAIDPDDGSTRRLVTGDGRNAMVVDSEDGPRLVFETSESDRYAVRVLAGTGARSELLYVGDRPWYEPGSALAFQTTRTGLAAPGHLLIAPSRRLAPAESDGAPLTFGTRVLVDVVTGERIALPEPTLESE